MAITNKTRLHLLWMLHEMLMHHKEIFPTVKFDLSEWAYNNKQTDDVACLLDGTCGSAGCAVGSACLHKEFNAMGLKLKHLGDCYNNKGNHFEPVYKQYTGWSAVTAFFGITYQEAEKVFCIESYIKEKPTAKDVAKRVMQLIEKYDA